MLCLTDFLLQGAPLPALRHDEGVVYQRGTEQVCPVV